MIWIFNREEELAAILSNEDKNSCPIIDAELHEVLNGDSTLDFTVPADHKDAAKILEKGYAAVQRKNGKYDLFIIEEINDSKRNTNEKEISCSHASTELKNDIIEDLFIDRKNVREAAENILQGTRWQLGTVTNDDTRHTYTVTEEHALKALSVLLERWQVEVSFSFDFNISSITNRKIHLSKKRGQDAGRRFEWTKDLTEIQRTTDASEVKTALIGIGTAEVAQETGEAEKINVYFTDLEWSKAAGDPADKPAGLNYVSDPEALAKYGRINADGSKKDLLGLLKVESEDPAVILQATWEALQVIKVPEVQYKLKLFDMAAVTGVPYVHVELGDTTAVIDDDLDMQIKARIIELKHNLLQEEETEIILGNFKPIFTDDDTEAMQSRLQDLESDIERRLEGKLDRGATVRTEWLEQEINLLQNKILAGQGTVSIDDGGILIEADPEGKTGGALRLSGGMLSLADEYNAAAGTYNWRSFGTGEGWLADLIQAGRISFYHAGGGTLSLGGQDDVDGVLSVKNAEGIETARLSGDYGGFGDLRIDWLKNTQNVLFKQHLHTFDEALTDQQTGDVSFYVDPVYGDDENIGTKESPKKSVQQIIDSLPKYINRRIFIYYVPTMLVDGEINISGFVGDGAIYLRHWALTVRYVRDWTHGNSSNSSNHTVEVQVIADSGYVAHAGGDIANISTNAAGNVTNLQYISDGNTSTNNYSDLGSNNGDPVWTHTYVRGGYYNPQSVKIWHWHGTGGSRTYFGTKVEVSADDEKWFTIFDSERQGTYKEEIAGRLHSLRHAHLKGSLEIHNNSATVEVDGLIVDASEPDTAEESTPTAVRAFKNSYVYLTNIVAFGNGTRNYNLYVYGGHCRVSNCEFNVSAIAAMCAAYGAVLQANYSKGGDTKYGIRSMGAIVTGLGTCPQGSTAATVIAEGGAIHGSWTMALGEYTSYRIVEKTKTWNNTAARSWDENAGSWRTDTDVLQGKWDVWGLYRGFWFFGTSVQSTVKGKNIKSIRIYATRANTSGTSSAVPIVFNWHKLASQPAGSGSIANSNPYTANFDRGQSRWLTVTNNWKAQFESGDAFGFGIYTSSTNSSNYARMTGSAKIEITYEDIE